MWLKGYRDTLQLGDLSLVSICFPGYQVVVIRYPLRIAKELSEKKIIGNTQTVQRCSLNLRGGTCTWPRLSVFAVSQGPRARAMLGNQVCLPWPHLSKCTRY